MPGKTAVLRSEASESSPGTGSRPSTPSDLGSSFRSSKSRKESQAIEGAKEKGEKRIAMRDEAYPRALGEQRRKRDEIRIKRRRENSPGITLTIVTSTIFLSLYISVHSGVSTLGSRGRERRSV